MMWLLWILLGLLVIILLVLMTKIKVKIRFQHVHQNDELVIKCSAWFGLIHYTINIPVIRVDVESTSVKVKEKTGMSDQTKTETNKRFTPDDFIQSLKNMKYILEHVVDLQKIIRHFLKKIQVKQFRWRSMIGMGDAAHTGVIVGACWGIKGSIIGLLTNVLHFKEEPFFSITPDFQNQNAETAFSCILQFRIGQAIVTGIKLLRYWKGSKVRLITEPFAKQKDHSNKQSM